MGSGGHNLYVALLKHCESSDAVLAVKHMYVMGMYCMTCCILCVLWRHVALIACLRAATAVCLVPKHVCISHLVQMWNILVQVIEAARHGED